MNAVLYFNEIEKFAAEWCGNLYPGAVVDQRSIADVRPTHLLGYRRVHLFAGAGTWEYALRLAGFDGPCWTGSCPCQPFSSAGKHKGTADARHLWPEMFRLVRECRPGVVFGEQVASKDGLGWLDGVFADLEGAGYTCRAADSCAAGVGSPHIRQRLFWVAYQPGGRCGVQRGEADARNGGHADGGVAVDGMADSPGRGCEGRGERDGEPVPGREGISQGLDVGGRFDPDRMAVAAGNESRPGQQPAGTGTAGGVRSVADRLDLPPTPRRGGREGTPGQEGCERERRSVPANAGGDSWLGEPNQQRLEGHGGHGDGIREPGRIGAEADGPSAAAGDWDGFTIVPCGDGKSRRIKSGLEPLVDGLAFRLADGRSRSDTSRSAILRVIGNGIVPQVAAGFVRAVMEGLGKER